MTETLDNNLQKQADAKLFCTVCKSVANRVLKIIKDKLSKDNIDMALDGICKKVGATDLCRRFIKKYREKLIDAIAAGGTANNICKSLKLCNDLRLHFQ
ncbi:hypothetical protein NFI96_021291 [Prochilodus magdalenae]|nr:hypothetical protein NFI96_021291 [Prochilodus magdalenae]